MNLNVELSPQVSDRLKAEARVRGIEPVALLEILVTEYLPSVETSPTISLPATGRAAARLRQRLAAEATEDPETIRLAEVALEEMKQSMNAERLRSGAGPIF